MVITIKDIAKEAGVSIATVSRVLNGQGGYTLEVQSKVMEITNRLGYRRNDSARSLVQKSTKTLGIIMPHLTTSFYGMIVSGIEDTAFTNGYSVIISHAGIEGERLRETAENMVNRRVDGVIIFSMELTEEELQIFRQLDIPMILISSEVLGSTIPFLKVDDYSAAFAAVEYLIQKGHTRIGIAGLSEHNKIAGKPRLRGYLDAMEEYGLRVDPSWIEYGDFSFEKGYEAMEHFIHNNANLTAVFGVSDEVALGVLSSCHKNHIRVPEDISVIGYDNSDIARMSIPPLTTISQPFYEMGQLACERMIEALKQGSEIISQIVSFDVIERDTVKTLTEE